MTALRQAAQQALEAMRCATPTGKITLTDWYKSITALRAALADGDSLSPTETVQEPVAWRFEARHIDTAWGAAVSLKHPGPEGVYMRNVVPLYTAPPQRPAEPVQEPVAWMHTDAYNPKNRHLEWSENRRGYLGDWIKRPLYTAPPQRKPLTKESLLHIYNQLPNWGMDMDRLPQGLEKFARAIERAHGIT